MSKPARLLPATDRRVRHADGRLFDAGGEWIVLDSFYRRLIADGDLVITGANKIASRRPKKGTSK